jgi:hypothetical protein
MVGGWKTRTLAKPARVRHPIIQLPGNSTSYIPMAADPISVAKIAPAEPDGAALVGARHAMPLHVAATAMPLAATASSPPAPRKPWALPPAGLAVFYGRPETPRLFHYFLPRLLAEGKQVLCLDGANRFDPLLIARLARQRGIAAAEFNRRIRVARAFTCFQLTELLVRVPRFLEKFAADALIVTALPDLYFDEDVRDREAAVAFGAALDALRALRPLPLGIGVFSDATSFQGPRRAMFPQLAAQATELWQFALDGENGKLRLQWRGLQPAGVGPCIIDAEPPQAEARATGGVALHSACISHKQENI